MYPKGTYINDSSYYIGVMPNGEKRYYVNEEDYLEDLNYYYEKNKTHE